MPIKFLLLGGVLGFLGRGGWKCQFYFYGRGDLSDFCRSTVPQGAAKGVRQKEFDHFFRFGTLSVTFSDAFTKLLLPDSFCGRST